MQRSSIESERGAAAVEFAIVMSVLFMLVFGIVEFGIAYNRSQGLEAAAREGARAASVGASYDEITARVQAAQSLFTPTDIIVTTVPPSSGSVRPCQIAGIGNTVTVSAVVAPNPAYAIAIPLWGNETITYNAAGVFRCERGSP
ncbi:MAG: TadE family protein [Actinomycetota bacterium]